ncbi:MAG: ABC transporter permease [Bryobacteraceae bacterium]
MSATYADAKAEPVRGSSLRTTFRVRNDSPSAWRRDEGFAFGYHVFDPARDTLLIDGPRTTLASDLAPGDSASLEMRVDLPAEPGRYRVFVSPMREDVAWFYDAGWRFLAIDAIVSGGEARVERLRPVTRRTIGRERFLRSAGRAFTLPIATLWRNRALIRTMVRRDVLGRYRGSFGGALWTVFTPLLLMLTYFFVFGIVLESRFAGDPSRAGFALYFLAGMLPWLAFSEAAGRAPSVLLEHRNFVKKLVFPVETLPVNLTAAGLTTQAIALLLFLIALLVVRGAIPATAAWLPALLVPQVMLTLAACWFLAALGVFVRDLGQVIGFTLTLWFFLTPICYPEGSIPPAMAPILAKNPIAVLVRGYRAVLLENTAPAWGSLWKLWIVSGAAFILGHAWFHKLRRSFADVV